MSQNAMQHRQEPPGTSPAIGTLTRWRSRAQELGQGRAKPAFPTRRSVPVGLRPRRRSYSGKGNKYLPEVR